MFSILFSYIEGHSEDLSSEDPFDYAPDTKSSSFQHANDEALKSEMDLHPWSYYIKRFAMVFDLSTARFSLRKQAGLV